MLLDCLQYWEILFDDFDAINLYENKLFGNLCLYEAVDKINEIIIKKKVILL
jgi:hypothetical protein